MGLYSYEKAVPNSTVHTDSARLWLNEFKTRYSITDTSGQIINLTTYYDPELDIHLRTANIFIGFGIAWYVLPQDPVLAKELYEAVKIVIGWPNSCPSNFTGFDGPHTMSILGLLLAQEFGDEDTVKYLKSELLQVSERKECGDKEEGYYFFRGEKWPRGQLSALLSCSHVLAKGQWHSFFNRTPEELAAQHGNPEVVGVDYPFLGLNEARCIENNTTLLIETYSATSINHLTTTFSIIKLPDTKHIIVECDGKEYKDWKIINSNSIELSTTCDNHIFYIRYGMNGGRL